MAVRSSVARIVAPIALTVAALVPMGATATAQAAPLPDQLSATAAGRGTTGPAAAPSMVGEPGPYQVRSRQTGRCLDTDRSGAAYYSSCNVSDGGQRWIIWNGGWVKNQVTGDCLTARNPSNASVTRDCAHVNTQYWRFWTPEWFQNVHYGSALGCLADSGGTHSAAVSMCYDSNPLYWYVQLW
ncbi:ricin-type beta-trefoil lectin domain protein [Actinomadura sp. 9N215]|uniref:ricin-type beta-trefoil lectin domain protein n=1 Tax=Actinomadura sp. 9N215 TaxID=3375150 RepID=UPI00379A47A1